MPNGKRVKLERADGVLAILAEIEKLAPGDKPAWLFPHGVTLVQVSVGVDPAGAKAALLEVKIQGPDKASAETSATAPVKA